MCDFIVFRIYNFLNLFTFSLRISRKWNKWHSQIMEDLNIKQIQQKVCLKQYVK